MPPKRGANKQANGSHRGQAPNGRGGASSNRSQFQDSTQMQTFASQDSDDVVVLNFSEMQILSEPSRGGTGSPRGRGGRGGGGGRHFIPSKGGPSLRGQYAPPHMWRGRGRGGAGPLHVFNQQLPGTPPRSNHKQAPTKQPVFLPIRGRGGGLGFVISPERPVPKNWDLSNRPLLKPIKFVRAKERLFEVDPEELLRAHPIPPHPSDELDPRTEILAEAFEDDEPLTSNIPTAEQSGVATPDFMSRAFLKESAQETHVDGENMHIVEQSVIMNVETSTSEIEPAQIDLLNLLLSNETAPMTGATPESINQEDIDSNPSVGPMFYADTTGSSHDASLANAEIPLFETTEGPVLGETQEPDEIILIPSPATKRAVSIASHQSGHTADEASAPMSTIPSPVITMETLSLSFTNTKVEEESRNKSLRSFSVNASGRSPFIPMRARKEAKRSRRDDAWKQSLGKVFGYQDGREGLRKGDSDLDVGSETSDQLEDNGMDVDEELDAVAMARFARGVNKPQASMADVEIEAALQNGDYDSSSDEEVEGQQEAMETIPLENEDDDDDWFSEDDDDDVDMTPTTSFKSRLRKVRERTPGNIDSEEADRVIDNGERSWADRDEDYIAGIERILDENSELLSGRQNRKERNGLFRAIHAGESDYPFAEVSSRSKNGKDMPDLLAEQWLRDRNKKAERKRAREEERALQGGLGDGKTKGKTRLPDLEEIEQMMRDLIASVGPGASQSFQLPPMDKSMREKVHIMAQTLVLKSSSSGSKKQEMKAITVSRTKKTGTIPLNERKLDAVMRRKRRKGDGPSGDGKYAVHIKEGEAIGHKAAKIGEGNIGYRLLAQMGWSEGDKIGREGGLEAPIVAIMKKSKLGLGASFA